MRRALVPGLVLLALALGAALWWAAARAGTPATRVDAPAATSVPAEDEPHAEQLVGAPRVDADPAPLGAPATAVEREAIAAARTPRNKPDPRDRQTPPATLRIRVTDELGAPIERFQLKYHALDDPDGARVRDVEQADGTFADEVHSGMWVVYVSADGHLDPGSGQSTLQQKVELPFLQHELPLVLRRVALLCGRVVDRLGLPVAEASVVVSRGQHSGIPTLFSATSDAKGRFEILALSGPCFVRASAPGWADSVPRELELFAGERLEVELELWIGGTLSGEVLRDGQPAAGASVVAFSISLGEEVETKSDAAGRFEIEHLTPGEYQVIAEVMRNDQETEGRFEGSWKVARAVVTDGERSHVVLGERKATAVRVHGLVKRAGQPYGGFVLLTMHEDGPLFEGVTGSKVADDGRFELELDEPGAYLFLAEEEPLSTRVTVPPGPDFTVTLALAAAHLSGVVRCPDGPLTAMKVELLGGPFLAYSIEGPKTTRTDRDGRYAFGPLLPGRYSLAAGGSGSALGRVVLDVELAPDEAVENADLELGPGLALRGRVIDAYDRPVAGASIEVQAESGASLEREDELTTDTSGGFTSRVLAANSVRVIARSTSGVSPTLETRLVHDMREVVLRIAPGASAVVACRDAEGRPLPATLSLRDERGFDHASSFTRRDIERLLSTGLSSSTFPLGPLPPGRYSARAQSADGRSARTELVLEAGTERRFELVLK